jgi:hypothetical protein
VTQISRPFQIVLAAFVVFAALWFTVLHKHSSSGESASTSQPAASAPAQSSAGGGTPASKGGVYHGSAPGVEGLSRAIQKARGAVAQSEQHAQHLQRQSGGTQAQGAQKQQSQAGQTQSRQAQSHSHQSQTQQSQAQSQPQKSQNAPVHTQSNSGVPAMQATVEGELKHGKVVAVLFWNPKGAVDRAVRGELRKASGSMHGKLAVQVARSSEVGSFGSFTRTAQVYSTPTILLINPKGKTSSLTGLTDAFSIEQSIKEIKHAH